MKTLAKKVKCYTHLKESKHIHRYENLTDHLLESSASTQGNKFANTIGEITTHKVALENTPSKQYLLIKKICKNTVKEPIEIIENFICQYQTIT